MSAALANPQLAAQKEFRFSQGKTILVEPLLILAGAAFWLFTLPFVAASLVCVKVGDALVAMEKRIEARPNPLILRRAWRPKAP